MRAVELFKCDRGDRIDRKLFLKLVTDVPYLIFPAFRLQEEMLDRVVGTRFWKRIKRKVEKREIERRRLEEIKKKEMRKKKKLEEIVNMKEKYFLKRMEGINL